MPIRPAFYDSGTETIYVVDGLPSRAVPIRDAAGADARAPRSGVRLGRAGHRCAIVDRCRGTRALYDADALATGVELTTRTTSAPTSSPRSSACTGPIRSQPSPSPFATAGGRAGSDWRCGRTSSRSRRPSVTPMATDAPISDGQVLDLRRLVAGRGRSRRPLSPRACCTGTTCWRAASTTTRRGRRRSSWRGDDGVDRDTVPTVRAWSRSIARRPGARSTA